MEFRLTISIPVYNRADIVSRTLDSVAAQTYRPLKIILVDNNSTDNTLEVLKSWRDKVQAPDFDVKIIQEKKQGLAFARNAALNIVETEWFMPFDSDDIMLPKHVENAMQAVLKTPQADIVGWDQIQISETRSCKDRFIPYNLWFYTLVSGDLSSLRYMAKTAVYKLAGGWDGRLPIMEDIELATRLIPLNPKIAKVESPEITCHIMLTRDSLSRQKAENYIAKSIPIWRQIENQIPDKAKRWADFSKVYVWACLGRCNISKLNLKNEDWTTGNALWRLILQLAYHYTSRGGRGAMRLFLLLSNKSTLP